MTLEQAIIKCASDTPLFGRTFFPRAIRMQSPEFHYEICEAVENPDNEKIAVKVLRGGAKTTLARIILSKRVAYAISKTMLVISETAEHSYETIKWLKHAVERQDVYARTFGLERGDKHSDPNNGETYTWRDDKIQIYHQQTKSIITIVGTGIFGQSRGLNIEDFRPDFILLDDVQDEDNSKTAEMRKKVEDRIYGAISNTLAPRSEAPTATMLFLQTPLHKQDAIEKAKIDPEWTYIQVSCFDKRGESVWPERWTTDELMRKKQGYILRNQLSIWLKEWEVTVTDDELSYFPNSWVSEHLYEHHPDGMQVYVAVDPTPPPKESRELSSSMFHDLDDFVILAFGVLGKDIYVLDTWAAKSPYPTEVANALFDIVLRLRPIHVACETILFARTVKYDLEREQLARRTFFQIKPVEDKRKKSLRIRQELTGLLSAGKVHLKASQTQIIEQIQSYPDVNHDDYIDALAIGIMSLPRGWGDVIEGEFEEVEDDVQALEDWRGCPNP